MSDFSGYKDMLVFLATAGVVVPSVHRLNVSPVLGFLAAVAVLGPFGLGRLADSWEPLAYVTLHQSDQIAGLAEFGVVFLMFVVGLELSLSRLLTMRRLVFGLGLAQVAVSALSIGGIAAEFGLKPSAALVVGTCLALSSTAIIVDMLAGQKRLPTTTGRVTFAILIAQDLAVVPILFIVETLGHGGDSVTSGLLMALAKGAVAIGGIVLVGRLLLKPLFRIVADTESAELFMAAILLVSVGAAVAAASAGLSMALGGFVAGSLLAETAYRRAIEATIGPFKGLLLGVFFFSVGMGFDALSVAGAPLLILGASIGLVLIKAAIALLLARLFGIAWPAAIKSALLIGPGGEFAFIVIGLAGNAGLVPTEVAAPILAIVALSMAAIPGFDYLGRKLSSRVEKIVPPDPATLIVPPSDGTVKALVVGYGRVGELVGRMLERHELSYIAVDRSAATVSLARRKGKPVYFGDITTVPFMKTCGIDTVAAVIVTVDAPLIVEQIVKAVRAMRTDIVIVARARDSSHARHLYEIGVTDAVPETIEASLQLSEAALVGLGVPMGPVIASVHDERDEYRRALINAAGESQFASETSRKGGLPTSSRKRQA
ncbi:MAG: cation:proton antiporter [Ancalomicrobiaceae bacterium]|nr:cation:proton antiporter [Ancalomicrobiaceae bacterium]